MITPGVKPSDFAGEYLELDDPDTDIEQGDILDLARPHGDEEEWSSHFGVVVTANCDLAHKKHGGILSYVPVVPVHVYVRAITLPRLLSAELERSRSQLFEAVPTRSGWPTPDRLAEMIELGDGVDAAAGSLPDNDSSSDVVFELRRLDACLRAQARCAEAESIETAIAAVDQMQRELRAIDGTKPPKPGWLLKDLAGRLTRSLPGDALFLDRLSPGDSRGYIAYLRLIREIRHDEIATSPIAEHRMGMAPAARRVGRLQLVYQHRLAQQMARVFSDIGLPDGYEQNWSAVINRQTQGWGEPGTSAAALGGAAGENA